jgi:hypothetical protein
MRRSGTKCHLRSRWKERYSGQDAPGRVFRQNACLSGAMQTSGCVLGFRKSVACDNFGARLRQGCTKIATGVSKKLVNYVIPGGCMRSSYWHDNHMCLQLCTAICQAVPENYNSKRLLSDGSKLLRNAFGLWDIFLKPDSGHADAINLCWCALMLLC